MTITCVGGKVMCDNEDNALPTCTSEEKYGSPTTAVTRSPRKQNISPTPEVLRVATVTISVTEESLEIAKIRAKSKALEVKEKGIKKKSKMLEETETNIMNVVAKKKKQTEEEASKKNKKVLKDFSKKHQRKKKPRNKREGSNMKYNRGLSKETRNQKMRNQ
jgi:hypothetical protein